MKTRINGIPMDVTQLTQYELDALMKMAEQRIEAAESDKEKLVNEHIRRSNNISRLTQT